MVKLSPHGKLLWYYQLTPHDLYDWDLQNNPVLTTANGRQVVVDGGKAGILFELDAKTGQLLWKLPVGGHNGHENDGLLTLAQAKAKLKFPYVVYPGILGGVESQIASDGTNVYAAVNNLASTYTNNTEGGIKLGNFTKGTGDIVALNQATGKIAWDHAITESPYGAASVTNDVPLHDDVRRQGLGAQHEDRQDALERTSCRRAPTHRSRSPATLVITAGSFPQGKSQKATIVAYRLPS